MRRKILTLLITFLLSIANGIAPSQATSTPNLTVSDQVFINDQVAVTVTSSSAGWVAIRAGNTVIGSSPVKAGTSGRIVINVDSLRVETELNAIFYLGESTTFDPTTLKPANDSASFKVAGIAPVDLQVNPGKVQEIELPRVISQHDGFVAIRVVGAWADVKPTPILGHAPIKAGVNEHIKIAIKESHWLLTYSAAATLFIDAGQKGKFEFLGSDIPVVMGNVVADQPLGLGETFIRVEDASATESKILTVPAVDASTASWLVLRTGGNKSTIIGYSPIQSGISHHIEIKITLDEKLPQYGYLEIFPRKGDKPTLPTDKDGNVIAPDLDIDAQRVLLNDSLLTELEISGADAKAMGGIVVSRLVLNQPTWLRVMDASDLDREDLAAFLLGTGVHYNVLIPMNPELLKAGGSFLIQLHLDGGIEGKFEFPGADVQVQDAMKSNIRYMLTLIK